MALSLFMLGSIWFWLLLLVSVVSITALIENEHNVIADIVFVATCFVLYKFGCQQSLSNLWGFISSHVWLSVLIFAGYFVAGTGYSILKWAIYVSDGRQRLIDKNLTFYESEWTPDRHKAKILHWMIYWPISGIWTLISNPIVKLFNRIFNRIKVVYQNISNRIMKDMIHTKTPREAAKTAKIVKGEI
jgi:hypothetical protein